MTLHTLSPSRRWEFIAAMSEAWAWTQERKRIYCDRGGEMTIEEYLAEAERPNVKQIAVMDDAMVAVVTIELNAEKIFNIHVTTRRGVKPALIWHALTIIRDDLFQKLDALAIYTSCGVYNGHENKGSRLMAEACGMTPTNCGWSDETEDGTAVYWREYCLTRENYYGRKEANNNERLSILSNPVVAGT